MNALYLFPTVLKDVNCSLRIAKESPVKPAIPRCPFVITVSVLASSAHQAMVQREDGKSKLFIERMSEQAINCAKGAFWRKLIQIRSACERALSKQMRK